MRLEVQYQFGDYRDALAEHQRAISVATEQQKMIAAAFMFLPAGMYMVLSWFKVGIFNPSDHTPLVWDLFIPMIPWLSILIWLWIAQVAAGRRQARLPWNAPLPRPSIPRKSRRPHAVSKVSVEIVVYLLVILVTWYGLLNGGRREIGDQLFLAWGWALLPWSIYRFWNATLAKATAGRAVRRSWEQHPRFTLPHTIEIDETGVTVRTPLNRDETPWQGIVGFFETPSMFLLYPSSAAFHMLPKRAFPNQEAIDQFCGLLQRKVPAGRFLPRASGFPVQSVAVIPASDA